MSIVFHAATIATYRGFRISLIETPVAIIVTATARGSVALMEVGQEREALFRRVLGWIDHQSGNYRRGVA